MKIALVIESMDPQRGGRETSTAQVAMNLGRRGHDVTILCQRACWDGEGVTVRPLGRRGLLRARRMRNFITDVRKAAAEGGYDVVHATLPVPGVSVYQPRGGTIPAQIAASARRWKLLSPIRTGIFERLNFFRRRLGQLERSIVADDRTLCLAVSEMVREEFSHYYGPGGTVRVIYNAVEIPHVDAEQRAQWRQLHRFEMGVGPGDPVFISVAGNFALKGIDETIRAFAKWNNRSPGKFNSRLVIVGRDTVGPQQRLANHRGVGREVVFVPPTREIYQWYAACDVCILLSWYDPCSRTVLEATCLGIPSITTVYNGAAEILATGGGIVVGSPSDTGGVVEALEELADPKRRAPRTEICLRLADRLAMDRHVDQLLEAYAEVAKPR